MLNILIFSSAEVEEEDIEEFSSPPRTESRFYLEIFITSSMQMF